MILLVDNFDSFVHNLGRYIGKLGRPRTVIRRNELTLDKIEHMAPHAIIISPGPCAPKDSGISSALIKKFGPRIPILGVCLGHQCIGEIYGGTVVKSPPCHGKASAIHHNGTGLFKDMPAPFTAGRYHSLAVDIPPRAPLDVTARTQDGIIMGLEHKTYPVYGLQFHPESILTEQGERLLKNFLLCADDWHNRQKSIKEKRTTA